jgi:hypothetical protein
MVNAALRNELQKLAGWEGSFLQGEAKGLLCGDVVRRWRRLNRFDPTGLPEMFYGSGPENGFGICGEEQAIACCPGTAAGSTESLQKRSRGGRGIDLD